MKTESKLNNFEHFFGQKRIKHILNVLINSSKKRKTVIDHILLYGAPGLGKTTLATIIAKEMNSKIHYAQGPLIEKKADVLSLFGSIQKGDVIFIDEIHGINKNVEELLYSALEEKVMDVTIGPEGDTKIVRMKLPDFTLIGATTKIGKISIPLKDRLSIHLKLEKYSFEEISKIIEFVFNTLKWNFSKGICFKIAKYANNTPRIAKNIAKRIIDYALFEDSDTINEKIVINAFMSLGMYKLGLNDMHITYLKCLGDNFEEKYVALETVSSLLFEDKKTIESIIEPILLESNLITKTSRGRKITNEGISYLTSYNLDNHL